MDEELVTVGVGETFEADDGHTYRVEPMVVNGQRAVRRIK